MTAKLKENLLAFFIAILLTGVVIVTLNSSNTNLATDILGKKTEVVNKSDMQLLVKNNKALLISNKTIDNIATITLELVYDENSVNIKKEDFISRYNISISKDNNANKVVVSLLEVGSIKKGESLLSVLGVNKEKIKKINIGHMWVVFNDGEILDLTIVK